MEALRILRHADVKDGHTLDRTSGQCLRGQVDRARPGFSLRAHLFQQIELALLDGQNGLDVQQVCDPRRQPADTPAHRQVLERRQGGIEIGAIAHVQRLSDGLFRGCARLDGLCCSQDGKPLPHGQAQRVDHGNVAVGKHLLGCTSGVIGGADLAADAETDRSVGAILKGCLVGLEELSRRRRRGSRQNAIAIDAREQLHVVDLKVCFHALRAKMDHDWHLPDTVPGGNVGRQAGIRVSNDRDRCHVLSLAAVSSLYAGRLHLLHKNHHTPFRPDEVTLVSA